MAARKPDKPEKPAEVTLVDVSPSVANTVAPSWSTVFSQWATAASAIAVALTLFGNIYFQHQQSKAAAEQAKAAAVKVEEVKQSLDASDVQTKAKLNDLADVAASTHTLVNSAMSSQLKISAVALRRIAVSTKDPDDIAAAELAESLLREHDAKQRKVDEKAKER